MIVNLDISFAYKYTMIVLQLLTTLLLLYTSVQSFILDITSGHKYNITLTATLAFPFTGLRWETAQPG